MKVTLLKKCFLFFYFFFAIANAQTVTDTLRNSIVTAKNDSVKVNALNNLALKLAYSNLDSSVLLTEKAISILTAQNAENIKTFSSPVSRKSALAYTFLQMGSYQNEKADMEKALKYLRDALELYEDIKDENGIAGVYRIMGLVYTAKDDYAKALDYAFKALKLDEKLNYKKGIQDDLANIGSINIRMNELEKALEYYSRALKLAMELKDKSRIAIQYGNLAIVYSIKKNGSKAREYFLKALHMQEELGNQAGAAMNYMNIGRSYMEEGDFKTALEHMFRALKITETTTGNKEHLENLYANIGDAYTSLKKYGLAREYLLNGLQLAERMKDPDYVMTFEYNLTRMYSEAGDYKRAFEHYDRYIVIRDSLYSLENTKKSIRTQMNFEFEKKEALQKAEHEKKVIALQAESRIHRNTRNFAIVLGIMILLLVSFSFVYFNNRKNLRLKEQYSQQLLLSQENEKKRISKELHDSIGQNLLFIKNQLIRNNDQQIMSSVEETLEEVRSISKDLYPNQLEKYGLIAAVDNLAEKVKETSDIFVSHDLEALNKDIPADKLINYYRIIQECISNAMKHSGATALRITAAAVNGGIELVVQDNGRGFEKIVLTNKAQRSFGMLNLEERAKFLKGKFEVETSPGKGTKCIFFFPG